MLAGQNRQRQGVPHLVGGPLQAHRPAQGWGISEIEYGETSVIPTIGSTGVEDDLAVVLHRDRMQATVLGEDRSGTFIITDVWRKGNDGWRVWRRHSTRLAAGRLPGVP